MLYVHRHRPASPPVDISIAGRRFGWLTAKYRRDRRISLPLRMRPAHSRRRRSTNQRHHHFVRMPACLQSPPERTAGARRATAPRDQFQPWEGPLMRHAHTQADRGHDLYETPACAVQALLRAESLAEDHMGARRRTRRYRS